MHKNRKQNEAIVYVFVTFDLRLDLNVLPCDGVFAVKESTKFGRYEFRVDEVLNLLPIF